MQSSSIDSIRELAMAAYDPETPMHRGEALFKSIADTLAEAGHYTMPQWAPLSFKVGRKTVSIHGYDLDDETQLLTVFHLLDCHQGSDLHEPWSDVSCPPRDLENAFAQLQTALGSLRAGECPELDEADPAAALCVLVAETLRKAPDSVSIAVWTTGTVSKEGWKRSDKSGLHTAVWDATRVERALSSGPEPLKVEFEGGIDCLLSDADYERLSRTGNAVLLGKIGGQILADLYFEHRTRLLQQNVRAFLQFTGSVNAGIRTTIATEPDRFLSYNNGIAVAASHVSLTRRAPGVYTLTDADDFQIVNGGQTTASLMHTHFERKADLSRIAVAMKLTVVNARDLDELVPKISRYANSQNKVQESDFASNNPWLVSLEQLSRRIEAPKDEHSGGQPLHWYFERVRGQFNADLGRQKTRPQKDAFKARNPSRSKFTKTDLATAAMTWEQEPRTVSLGTQKNFAAFVRKLAAAKEMTHGQAAAEPSEEDFRRLVCLLILRRAAEGICRNLQIPAFRPNFITYAIALLSVRSKGRLPWAQIWETQAVPGDLEKTLRIAIRGCQKVLQDKAGGRMISEFAKKDECWEAVLGASIELETGTLARYDAFSVADTVKPPELVGSTQVFFKLSEKDWTRISASLKKLTDNTTYLGVAATMARLSALTKKPTEKQARILAKALLLLRKHRSCGEILDTIDADDWAKLERAAV